MNTKVAITGQPASTAVANGAVAKVTVNATGEGLTYKWFYKDKGATSFTQAGSKTNAYAIAVTSAISGRQVYCVITDQYGTTVTTKTVTVSMKATISSQPASVKVTNGAVAKVTVGAVGEGLTYKWYYKDKNGKTFTLAGSKTNYYAIAVNSVTNGRQVYCVITDKYGNTVTTKVATINLKATITSQPASVTVSNGAVAKVTVGAVGEGLTYKWYYKDKTAKSFSLAGSKTNFYAIAMNSTVNGRQVYCVITDKFGNTATTNVVTVNRK